MDNSMYNTEFYKMIYDGSYRSARNVLPIVLDQLTVQSAVDFGCGAGTWLKVLNEMGIDDIQGVDFGENAEQLVISRDQFMKQDMTVTFYLGRQYDLVISLEVAEHLSESHAANFVETLCRHGKAILFSAAIPGQGGVGHYNEQYISYWEKLFKKHGYYLVDSIRPKIWNNEKIETCYRQNMVWFIAAGKRLCIDTSQQKSFPVLDVVHPAVYKAMNERKELWRLNYLAMKEENIRLALSVMQSSMQIEKDILSDVDVADIRFVVDKYIDQKKKTEVYDMLAWYFYSLGQYHKSVYWVNLLSANQGNICLDEWLGCR